MRTCCTSFCLQFEHNASTGCDQTLNSNISRYAWLRICEVIGILCPKMGPGQIHSLIVSRRHFWMWLDIWYFAPSVSLWLSMCRSAATRLRFDPCGYDLAGQRCKWTKKPSGSLDSACQSWGNDLDPSWCFFTLDLYPKPITQHTTTSYVCILFLLHASCVHPVCPSETQNNNISVSRIVYRRHIDCKMSQIKKTVQTYLLVRCMEALGCFICCYHWGITRCLLFHVNVKGSSFCACHRCASWVSSYMQFASST